MSANLSDRPFADRDAVDPGRRNQEAMSLSWQLGRFVSTLGWQELPDAVRAAFRRTMIDYLSCVAAGSGMPQARAAREYAAAAGGQPVATVIGSGMKAAMQDAAFANGTAAHALDFDDGHREGSAHPGGVIISAALAVAESIGSDWSAFSEAVVAGYEVMLRISAAIHPASALRGWHNSSVAGVFGSAAASGRLLGLDANALGHAMGLAGSFSGGIREYLYDGSDVKRLHLGKAARDGILCAELAGRGLTGPRRVLEGANGLFRALTGGEADPERVLRGIGSDWEMAAVYFKPYPCCRHFQAAIDAVLELRDQAALEAIADIEIGLYGPAVPGHTHTRASTLLDAQMSAPCAIVTALVHGSPGVRHFEPDIFASDQVRGLLSKTRVVTNPLCDVEYPAVRGAIVKLTLNDGSALERRVRNPKGEAENPLSDDELRRKLAANCTPGFSGDEVEKLSANIFADAYQGRPVTDFTADIAAGFKQSQWANLSAIPSTTVRGELAD
ncbi:MmgE/PrpD family protein [Pelagibacterium nitratireducens]|uniref:MmgE/PrpD family protein n=1 Tax=Pelagibacterium nitratireducens TaxID=1046114 RepID=A0ABZ2I6R1_9HYPH